MSKCTNDQPGQQRNLTESRKRRRKQKRLKRIRRESNFLERSRRSRRLRCHLPESIQFITRRTIFGSTFMAKNPRLTRQVFMYFLSRAATRSRIRVLAIAIMANHVHLVVYDPDGVVSDFCAYFFRNTAIVMNRALGRSDKFWDGGRAGICELPHDQTVVGKVLYTMHNPEHHGAADTAGNYAGFVTSISDIANEKEFRPCRPSRFMSENTELPARGTITFHPPPNYKLEEWVRVLRLGSTAFLTDRVQSRRPTANGSDLTGVVIEMDQDTEPLRSNIAGPASIQRRVEEHYQRFVEDHDRAVCALLKGEPVPFPPGTVGIRRAHGAEVLPLTPSQRVERLSRLSSEIPPSEVRYATRIG